jgi:hypothetical protein
VVKHACREVCRQIAFDEHGEMYKVTGKLPFYRHSIRHLHYELTVMPTVEATLWPPSCSKLHA